MKLLTFSFGVLFFVLCSAEIEAATLYIDPGLVTLNRGDAVTASVRLMPDQVSGECINAVDAVISYPDNIQPIDYSIGRSIFSVWVENPTINKENRTITFAGGIPNGYCGRVEGDPSLTNILVDIVFRSPGFQVGGLANDSDVAVIDFLPETQAYLNDGQGTRANLRTLGSTISLNKTAGAGGIVDDWREVVRIDNLPPEPFSILLERDDRGVNFNGNYYIVFSTTDKQTGISHYEVMEEPVSELGKFKWGGTDASWIRTDKPVYELKDQSLNSTIRVRAYDKAGNEYVATLLPAESLRSISNAQVMFYTVMTLSVLLVIFIFAFGLYFYRRRKIQSASNHSTVNIHEL